MNVTKHVGKHNGNKCVVVFRKVPNEDHMCLVVYPDTLNRHVHDDIMAALESASGQQAKEFSDYLFRYTMADGRNALTALHSDGRIKKVPCNQVIMTPNAKTQIRLDELNDVLDKMEAGEEAVKELAELDRNAGMVGSKKRVNEGRELGVNPASKSIPAQVDTAAPALNINDVLSDEQLSQQRLAQSQRMIAEANSLLAEAKRLQEEAASLSSQPKKTTKTNGKTKKAKGDQASAEQ